MQDSQNEAVPVGILVLCRFPEQPWLCPHYSIDEYIFFCNQILILQYDLFVPVGGEQMCLSFKPKYIILLIDDCFIFVQSSLDQISSESVFISVLFPHTTAVFCSPVLI